MIQNTTNNSAVNLTFQNTQIWKLTGNNTFSGGITIGGGRVIADKLANTGNASSIGTGGVVRFGYFNNAGSTFEYVGSGASSNMQIKLGASGDIPASNASFLQNGNGSALVLTNTNFTLTGDVNPASLSTRVLIIGGNNTADNTIQGIIGNSGTNATIQLVKSGTGKWILSGNNTYTGGTTVSAGTLIINGNNTAANGAFSVASGATLGGTGTIGGAATINGNLSPGDNGPGVLKFASSLTLTSTAATLMELNGVVRGSGYDGINVLGPMVYNGSLTLNFGSLFLSNGATFDLFSMTGGTTTGLTGVNFSGAYGSGAFTANGTGQWINTSTGADWAFSEGTGLLTINVVPEPGTWALLTISLAWLLLFRVRPRTSAKRRARASHL